MGNCGLMLHRTEETRREIVKLANELIQAGEWIGSTRLIAIGNRLVTLVDSHRDAYYRSK